jgi:hypothetical protein
MPYRFASQSDADIRSVEGEPTALDRRPAAPNVVAEVVTFV